MAPEQSSQTETAAVSPVQSSASPSTQPREPSPLAQTPQRGSTTTDAGQNPYGLYPQSYGGHYVPYDQTAPQQLRQMQQQQQQQQAQMGQQPVTYMTVPQAFQQPPESNKRKISRDVMHVIVMIICILGIGFSFSLLGRATNSSTDRYGYYYDYFDYYIPAISAGPIFIFAFLWSLIELIVRYSRQWKSGIHPGAHVGVCLCIWLGAVIVGSILAVFVTQTWYYNCSSTSSRYSACYRYSDPMFVGSTVLILLLSAFEIVIFIMACTDTHIRNKWKRSVVIASTPYWAPPPQGWYVAPGQQQPQQPQQQYFPMAQPPMNQAPFMQAQQPMMMANNARAAPTPVGPQPQPGVAQMGGSEKTPAQAQHDVREFYTPGTAQ